MSLEAELLALAGEDSDDDVQSPARRTPVASSPKKRSRGSTGRSRKKARHDDSDDDNQESETMSDDDSFGAASDSDRDAPMEMESDTSDDEGGEVLYPLEGKYKDHADKEKLLAMTEIDREAVLADRMAQIERAQQDRHLRNLLKSRTAADAAAASTRKSTRTKSAPKKSEEATKRGKLDELRRNREERKATGGRKNSFGDEDASRKMKDDDDEEDGAFADDYVVKEERPIELGDVNRCRIGRTGLAKLCDYPGFEETVTDVFVRATLFDKEKGCNVYRMAFIKGFTTGKPYSMLDGARRTDRHLVVVHGKAEKLFSMDTLSDSAFTEHEFNRFKTQCELDGVPLPTLSHVQAKARALRALDSRTLTTEEINAMIAKRQQGKHTYLKYYEVRHKLQREREAAIADGDDEAVHRIDQELQELEDRHRTNARPETQMERMARINNENRHKNREEIRRAELAEKKAAREALMSAEKGGGSFANPFMRVKTVVKFRHDMSNKEDIKKEQSATPPVESKPVEKKDANGVGVMNHTLLPKGRKRGGVDDVIASMDLGIDIDV